MITIAFNEEENGQANDENEELENINSTSEKIISDDKKEKLNEKKEKAKDITKEFLKNTEVKAFILSHLVPILIVIVIIISIIILIGQYAFFTTMPGMILEKIKEFGRSVWGDFVGFFTGDSITASVSQEDVLNLAQYIQNMGYDIESCGFGKAEYEDASDEETSNTKTLKSIGKSVDDKEYLKAYIASNEATYVLANFGLLKFLDVDVMGNGIPRLPGSGGDVGLLSLASKLLPEEEEISTGMINIIDTSSSASDDRFVKIDRENEKMTVYTKAVYLPIVGALTNELGLTENGAIQWGSTFSYDMASWTAKYGKPIELFLSVHLSTMMPDLSYRIARDKELNTKVNIVLQNINVKYDTKVKSVGGNAANITTDQIVNAFLNYGLSGERYEYTEDVVTTVTDNNGIEETVTETVTKDVNFYNEILQSLTTQEERNQFFRNIIQQAKDNFVSDSFGINIANALINDGEGNAIGNLLKRFKNHLFSLAERLFNGGDSKYIVYIKKGAEQVPGLDGITYDDLFELADIVAQGLEDGIDGVKWPYIQSVTKHWYYEDVDFSKGVYRKATSAKKKIKYASADEENSALSKHNIEVELDATLSADEGIVYQVCEPEAKGPNEHIIEIFKDSYYRYDGTVETAKKIENAKLYDKYDGFIGHVIDEDGKSFTIEDKNIEKEEVSFEGNDSNTLKGNKTNALAAFSILENMHTEEAEFVYRNLKDLVVNLEYFSKDELTSDLKNAMMWMIKTDDKNEEFEVGKDENEYGMVIKGVGGREVIAPENCEITSEDDVVTLKFTKMSDETVELLKYIYEKDYKEINPDMLVGLTMKIKGIKDLTKTGNVERGTVIGTADSELKVIMFDIDKSIIEDVEEYMTQGHNNTYEAIMKEKKNKHYEEGIDIGRADENVFFGNYGSGANSAISTGHGTWQYSASDFDLLCAITRQEAGDATADNYAEALNVISTACNRTEDAEWRRYGSDPLSQYKAPGQYTYSIDGLHAQWLGGNYSDDVVKAVQDALNGVRSHSYCSFRGYPGHGRVQLVPGGNYYN